MALTGAINGVAPASAPVIGGVTADAFGWKGVFVVLALFALMILVCSPWVKESLARSRRVTVGPLRAFAGYKVLLTDRAFMTHVCLKGVALGLLFAYISATPFIMQNHYGLSETAYGLVIGFNALFMAAGAMAALKFRLLKRAATVGAVIVAITVAGVAPALWFVHSLVLFEVLIVVVMFGLGLIFTSANTLAMNEGRVKAGEASSVLGVAGYMVGAVVSPLVGMGNILHSTAIVFVVLALTVLWLSRQSKALVPDLQK